MAIKDWFKRTKTYDCLIVDEVPDGMPVVEGDLKRLTLDGDSFVDKHLGLLYTRDREIRPVRIRIDKKIRDVYLVAQRAGAALGTVMVNEGLTVRQYTIAGQCIALTVDELVLKMWTDPVQNYNLLDNNGLKTLTKQNLLGFEVLILITVGILLGWFVIGPVCNFLVAWMIKALMGFMGAK